MLLVKTYLNHSKIHGLGVFAGEPIPKGTPIWEFHHGLDNKVDVYHLGYLPAAIQEEIRIHGYRVDAETIIYCGDNTKYMNHCETANIISVSPFGADMAVSNIDINEELTIDYRTFDLDWELKVC